jgi:exopolysaccharide biosynthesis WecB/TagA/CpsF family protein
MRARARGAQPKRVEGSVSQLLDRLLAAAPRGLALAYQPETATFAHTVRRNAADDEGHRAEGTSLRYAAMAALGISVLPVDAQQRILAGSTATALAEATLRSVASGSDPGALGLACWAAAETGADLDKESLRRLIRLAHDPAAIPTVDASWVLTALVAIGLEGATGAAAHAMAARLMAARRDSRLFPHNLPETAASRLRRHVGCFADQVYPIQALARYAAAAGDAKALSAANACAATICALQGPEGQWWWHYDIRTGDVVEGYPVYSVHQHGMAPMALIDLARAGGADFSQAVIKGLKWIEAHPEVDESLVDEDRGLVWRSVRRREPRHAARYLRAASHAVHPSLRLGGLDRLLPPTRVDYECRPYELGWLLYAWRFGAVLPPEPNVATSTWDPAVTTLPAVPRKAAAMMRRQHELFGVPIDAMTMDEVVDVCRDRLALRRQLLIGVVNAAKLVAVRSDDELRRSLLECDLIVADGQAVVWASRLLRKPLPERVAGIDLFERLLELADREQRSVYLLGATASVVRGVETRILSDHPGVKVVGARDGYFTEQESAWVAEDIRASGADMLFVGMASPKKEIFLRSWGHYVGVPILHGVGGSFDVMAGLTRRAPKTWQRLGFEWLYRVLQEPRRLWRRYLTTNVAFLAITVSELVRRPASTSQAGSDVGSTELPESVIHLGDRRLAHKSEAASSSVQPTEGRQPLSGLPAQDGDTAETG